MIPKCTYVKLVPQDRIQAISFEPIPEEGDPEPLYRVMVHVGPGADFGCLLNFAEAEKAVVALEADEWKKEEA